MGLEIGLTWEEYQDVTRRSVRVYLEKRAERGINIVDLTSDRVIDFNGMLTAFNVEYFGT